MVPSAGAVNENPLPVPLTENPLVLLLLLAAGVPPVQLKDRGSLLYVLIDPTPTAVTSLSWALPPDLRFRLASPQRDPVGRPFRRQIRSNRGTVATAVQHTFA